MLNETMSASVRGVMGQLTRQCVHHGLVPVALCCANADNQLMFVYVTTACASEKDLAILVAEEAVKGLVILARDGDFSRSSAVVEVFRTTPPQGPREVV